MGIVFKMKNVAFPVFNRGTTKLVQITPTSRLLPYTLAKAHLSGGQPSRGQKGTGSNPIHPKSQAESSTVTPEREASSSTLTPDSQGSPIINSEAWESRVADEYAGYVRKLWSFDTELEPGVTYLTGTCIFRNTDKAEPDRLELLVLKRADHDDTFAGHHALPGGHVDPGERIIQGLAREALEETGLVIDTVVDEFEEMRWTSKSTGRSNVQLNYVVRVKEPLDIQLDPNEHSAYLWVSESQIDTLNVTARMAKVLRDAFACAKKCWHA